MKRAPRPGMLLVATRELRWMWRDRVAAFLVLGVPLIAFCLLAITFSNAVLRDLRVTIVDSDRSATSMSFIQAISSAPGVRVADRSADMTSAMHDVRSGKALAAVYIPENFERDFMGRKRPQIIAFYNRQFLTAGNNVSSSLSSAISAATARLPSPDATAKTPGPGSLLLEEYVLTNPALNFAQFLLRAILPTVLHVITAIAGGYAVGSEFSSRNHRVWLRSAGGSPIAALVGKLAPYFLIFLVMMVVVAGIVHGLFHVPFRGDSIIVGAGAGLLIIAYLALGALLQLLVRNLSVGLSLTGIICSPAFGFAGVGYPVLGMSEFAQSWGKVLPLRWYIQILFDQAVRGLPASISVQPFTALAALALVYLGLAWWRLSAIARARTSPRGQNVSPPTPSPPHGMGQAMVRELGRVLNDSGALGLIMLAPVIYGLFYPQPYLGQLLRGLPVSVVDQDNTDLSRALVQTLNADEATRVVARANGVADAQAQLDRRQVFGILVIPEGTEREVLKGNGARIGAYVDSAYFLVYSRIWQGMSEAVATVNESVAARGARLDGSLAQAGIVRVQPVEALSEPLFNPTGGYASYVVPAAFLLIIQQTLLMGIASVGGATFYQSGPGGRKARGAAFAIIGQALAHLCLASPGLLLYLVILPHIYGFSTLGNFRDLVVFAIPFVLSISFLAQFVGAWFKRRETAVLLFIATSLPLFFMVGVAWPTEAIPDVIRTFSWVFPSTSAIDGLVRINQMGASLGDVKQDWSTLWLLTSLYAVLACLSTWILNRREKISGQ